MATTALSLGNSVAMDTSSDVGSSLFSLLLPLFLSEAAAAAALLYSEKSKKKSGGAQRQKWQLPFGIQVMAWLGPAQTDQSPGEKFSPILYLTSFSMRLASPKSKLTGKWNLCLPYFERFGF